MQTNITTKKTNKKYPNPRSHQPSAERWAKRLFKFEFDSSTRKLNLQANGNLPDAKTIWVVPQGQYSIVLKEIEIKSTVDETYDIPLYLNTKNINLITRHNLDMLVSYRKIA